MREKLLPTTVTASSESPPAQSAAGAAAWAGRAVLTPTAASGCWPTAAEVASRAAAWLGDR